MDRKAETAYRNAMKNHLKVLIRVALVGKKLEWVMRVLLKEDRGSEGQRSWDGGVSEGRVEGLDVESMGVEEFGDGVSERW